MGITATFAGAATGEQKQQHTHRCDRKQGSSNGNMATGLQNFHHAGNDINLQKYRLSLIYPSNNHIIY